MEEKYCFEFFLYKFIAFIFHCSGGTRQKLCSRFFLVSSFKCTYYLYGWLFIRKNCKFCGIKSNIFFYFSKNTSKKPCYLEEFGSLAWSKAFLVYSIKTSVPSFESLWYFLNYSCTEQHRSVQFTVQFDLYLLHLHSSFFSGISW